MNNNLDRITEFNKLFKRRQKEYDMKILKKKKLKPGPKPKKKNKKPYNILLILVSTCVLSWAFYDFIRNNEEVVTKPTDIVREYEFKITEDMAITSDFIKYKTNGTLPLIMADYIAFNIHELAPVFGLDVSFVVAKVWAESAFDATSVSVINGKPGAVGILQVYSKGVGYDKKTDTYKVEFDNDQLHNIREGMMAGLQIFKEKMNQVQNELKKDSSIKNRRNTLLMVSTKYVGASSEKGKRIAKAYTDKILRVQGEYVLFRSTYSNKSLLYSKDLGSNKSTVKNGTN